MATISEGSNTEPNPSPHLDMLINIPDKAPTVAAEYRNDVWSLMKQFNSRLEQLPKIKSDIVALDQENKTLSSNYDDLKTKYDTLHRENLSNKSQVNLLSSQIALLEKKLAKQSSDHDDLTSRSMNQNLVFSFKQASNGEAPAPSTAAAKAVGNDAVACKRHVETIIKDTLRAEEHTITVVRAHRLGEQKRDGKCAPIIARLTKREMVGEALKLGKNLKDTGIFMNPQLPPNVAERRQFCRDDYMNARSDPNATAKMSNDRLFINNQLQRHLLAPNLPDTDIKTFEPRDLVHSQVINNDHCNVQCFKSNVSSLEDVRSAFDTVLAKATPTPDSLVYAYRFDDGSIRQNFDSGGEGGMGFKILRGLQDKHEVGTMLVVGIWYNNRNAPMKGQGFYKNFYNVINEVLT